MPTLDYEGILKALPHRYPMLLVDRITECDDEKYIVGIKNLSFNEPFLQGHFPGNPIMPGVLQLEAMAQVGGILLNRVINKEGQIAYFMTVDSAKFRKIVRPGDQLRIEVTIKKIRLNICLVHGVVTVGGEVASEADLKFGGAKY